MHRIVVVARVAVLLSGSRVRNADRLLGVLVMKKRHLEKMGYIVHIVRLAV